MSSGTSAWVRVVPHLWIGSFLSGLLVAGVWRDGWVWGIVAGVVVLGGAAVGRMDGARLLVLVALALALLGWGWAGARHGGTAVSQLSSTSGLAVRVVVESWPAAGAQGWRFRGRISVSNRDGTAGRRVFVETDDPRHRRLVPGVIVAISGQIRPAVVARDPTWWRRYTERQQVSGVLIARSVRIVGRRGGVSGIRDRLRARLTHAAGRGLDPTTRSLVRGMALGGGGGLPEDVQEDFRRSGIWHLLAVSGQNVGFVAICVAWLAGLAGARLRGRAAASLVCVVVYCLSCDGGASVVRAGVVGSLVVTAQMIGTSRERWYLLLVALTVLLAWQPRNIADPGLQLSFAAVVGLLCVAPSLAVWLRGVLPARAAELVAVSVAASLATAPVAIVHFGTVSIVGLAVNLVAVPVSAIVVCAGLAGALLGSVSRWLGAGPNLIAGLGADTISVAADWGGGVSWATVEASWAGAILAACVVCAVPAFAWWLWRAPVRGFDAAGVSLRALCVLGCAGGVAVLVTSVWRSPDWPSAATLSVLDVGQGDAILLRSPEGGAALIDLGPDGEPAAVVGQLDRLGVRRLDAVFVTHDQADHVGGLRQVLRHVEVARLFAPQAGDVATSVGRAHDVRVTAIATGDQLRVGRWTLTVVAPHAERRIVDPNAGSLVLHVRSESLSALLTADAEGESLTRAVLPRVDVLKVAHHGSQDVSLRRLLGRVRPRVAVISVGKANRFGHPHPTTLQTLASDGMVVRRTDRDGVVHVYGQGDDVVVSEPGWVR